MANYFQAVELVFGAEKRLGKKDGVDNIASSLLAKLVLQDSNCWQSMSALFNPTELESLFKKLYCLEIWHQLSADRITSQVLAECLFNNALINDPPEVIHTLQTTLGITPTGTMDQNTLTRLQNTSVFQVMKQLEHALRYRDQLTLLRELQADPARAN